MQRKPVEELPPYIGDLIEGTNFSDESSRRIGSHRGEVIRIAHTYGQDDVTYTIDFEGSQIVSTEDSDIKVISRGQFMGNLEHQSFPPLYIAEMVRLIGDEPNQPSFHITAMYLSKSKEGILLDLYSDRKNSESEKNRGLFNQEVSRVVENPLQTEKLMAKFRKGNLYDSTEEDKYSRAAKIALEFMAEGSLSEDPRFEGLGKNRGLKMRGVPMSNVTRRF